MCGIFGIISGDIITYNTKKFIDNMFIIDSVRGFDSCGLVVASGNKAQYFKRAIPAHDFINHKKYDNTLMGSHTTIFGHNRWATKGGVDSDSAHPFHFGNIVMVHNGTLRGQYLLPDSDKFDVDSENIAYSINKVGIEETWENIYGAAVLVWYDTEKQSTFIIKNDERPLHLVNDGGGTIYFASEKYMLLAGLERNKIEWKSKYQLKNDHLYEFKAGKDKKVVTSVKKLKAYTPIISTTTTGRGNKRVDAMVVTITKMSRFVEYELIDNNDPNKTYIIEDYAGKVNLELYDCITAEVSYISQGVHYLNKTTIKHDSEFEHGDEKENSDEDFPPEVCSWCSSPIQADEEIIEDGIGGFFCSDCAKLPEVYGYLEGEIV